MKQKYININRIRCISLLKYILIVLLLFPVSSCDSFLDVKPEGELTGDKMLQTSQGFEDALYGVYATMYGRTLYGESLTYNTTDVLAQYFTCQGNEYVVNLLQYNYDFADVASQLLSIWRDMYKNISNVNNVLENLESFSETNFAHYNIYKGEALGLRAFMHFDLLRLFTENIQQNGSASGIPYVTKFSLSATPFSTAQEVYGKIIDDLLEAEKLLKDDENYFTFPKVNNEESFLKDREIHFNLYAVQATLARVYFTKGDMPNALLYAEKVINSQKFDLMDKSNISGGKMRGVLYPKEAIFGLYSDSFFTTAYSRFFLETSFFSYDLKYDTRDVYIGNEILEGHDFRWEGFFKQPTVSHGRVRFVKLVDSHQINPDLEFLRPKELIKGINMIRLPEMYYIAAEALLLSNADKARNYFDKVIASRGLIPLKERSSGQALTVNHITNERYKEFIGEGQTFYNMKRLNLDFVNINAQPVQASKAVYVLPIPTEEIDYRN